MKAIVLLAIAYFLSICDFVNDKPSNVSFSFTKGIVIEIKLPEKVNEASVKYTEIQKDIVKSIFLEF